MGMTEDVKLPDMADRIEQLFDKHILKAIKRVEKKSKEYSVNLGGIQIIGDESFNRQMDSFNKQIAKLEKQKTKIQNLANQILNYKTPDKITMNTGFNIGLTEKEIASIKELISNTRGLSEEEKKQKQEALKYETKLVKLKDQLLERINSFKLANATESKQVKDMYQDLVRLQKVQEEIIKNQSKTGSKGLANVGKLNVSEAIKAMQDGMPDILTKVFDNGIANVNKSISDLRANLQRQVVNASAKSNPLSSVTASIEESEGKISSAYSEIEKETNKIVSKMQSTWDNLSSLRNIDPDSLSDAQFDELIKLEDKFKELYATAEKYKIDLSGIADSSLLKKEFSDITGGQTKDVINSIKNDVIESNNAIIASEQSVLESNRDYLSSFQWIGDGDIDISKVQAVIKSLSEEIDDLKNKNKELQESLNANKVDSSSLENYKQQVEENKAVIDGLTSKIDELNTKMQTMHEGNAGASGEVDTKQLDGVNERVDKLETDLKELRTYIDNINTDSFSKLSESIKEVEENLKNTISQVKELSGSVDAIKSAQKDSTETPSNQKNVPTDSSEISNVNAVTAAVNELISALRTKTQAIVQEEQQMRTSAGKEIASIKAIITKVEELKGNLSSLSSLDGDNVNTSLISMLSSLSNILSKSDFSKLKNIKFSENAFNGLKNLNDEYINNLMLLSEALKDLNLPEQKFESLKNLKISKASGDNIKNAANGLLDLAIALQEFKGFDTTIQKIDQLITKVATLKGVVNNIKEIKVEVVENATTGKKSTKVTDGSKSKKQEATDSQKLLNINSKLLDLYKKQFEIKTKQATGKSTNQDELELLSINKKITELYKEQNNIRKASTEDLTETLRQNQERISQLRTALQSDLVNAQQKEMATKAQKALNVDASKFISKDSIIAAQSNIQKLFDKIRSGAELSTQEVQELNAEIDRINNLTTSFYRGRSGSKLVGNIGSGGDIVSRRSEIIDFLSDIENNSDVAFKTFTRGQQEMIVSIRQSDNRIRDYRVSLNSATGDVNALYMAERQYTSFGSRWISGVKKKVVELSQYITGISLITRAWTELQRGFTTVRELDTAYTEMRKVSDETVNSLKAFQEESFGIANSVGATGETIQNSTADWMRLGEAIDDASESAQASNILLNVSEFENIDAATESLVAMSSAYKDLEKMNIVDKLNEVGKLIA